MPATTTAYTSTCTLNGQPVDCAQLAHQAGTVLKWGFGGFVVVLVIALLATIFWIMMLVHAAKHPVENKAVWIIAMLVTGVLGAIVYYFAVKRGYSAPVQSAPASSPVPPTEPPVTPAA